MKIRISQGSMFLFIWVGSYQESLAFGSSRDLVSFLYLENKEERKDFEEYQELLRDRFKGEVDIDGKPLLKTTVLTTSYVLIKEPENLGEFLLTRSTDSVTISSVGKVMKYLEEINYGK